jgi:UDP-2,3-diacylglucosamine pyrophosphatase LpxH
MGLEDQNSRAPVYDRPLTYTSDSRLRGRGQGLYYVFRAGALDCTEGADHYKDVCLVGPHDMNVIAPHNPGFVYLDCGAWMDNADGKGKRVREFGLVCGPHVYLCNFVGGHGVPPDSSVPIVQSFFHELARNGCVVNVQQYVNASKENEIKLSRATLKDHDLYLIVPDFHMPPATWFYNAYEVGDYAQSMLLTGQNPLEDGLPKCLGGHDLVRRRPSERSKGHYRGFYNDLLGLVQHERNRGTHSRRVAKGPITGNPDIFRSAGEDLTTFLTGLRNLGRDTKKRLHFIQLGDMFELWLGRDYQYGPGDTKPKWAWSGASVLLVGDWALEVMIQNAPVFDALLELEGAGLAEVKYLWGNHDAYVEDKEVTGQLGVPERAPVFQSMNSDLFVEHGHRFDTANYDNLSGWTSGPVMANLAYWMPAVRKAEPIGRAVSGLGEPGEVDSYLLGASLIYLWQKNQGQKPFSIYVMGHTHASKLFVFTIRTVYHLYSQQPSGARVRVK